MARDSSQKLVKAYGALVDAHRGLATSSSKQDYHTAEAQRYDHDARRAATGFATDHAMQAQYHALRAVQYAAGGDLTLSDMHNEIAHVHQEADPHSGDEIMLGLATVTGGPDSSMPPVDMDGKAALDARVAAIPPKRWQREVNSSPIVSMPVASLRSTQTSVKAGEVLNFVRSPDLSSKDSDHVNQQGFRDDVPIVVEWRGVRWIWDGHHRVAGQVIRREQNVDVRLVKLG